MEGEKSLNLYPSNGSLTNPSKGNLGNPFGPELQFCVDGSNFDFFNRALTLHPDTSNPNSQRNSGGSGWSSADSLSPRSVPTTPLGMSPFDFNPYASSQYYDQNTFSKECPMPDGPPIEPGIQSIREEPRRTSRMLSQTLCQPSKPRYKYNFCVFCKNNGEDESFFLTHTLKDDFQRITCPVLYNYKCPICSATGPVAHTIRYCPKAKNTEYEYEFASITELKKLRSSAGVRPSRISQTMHSGPGIIGNIPPSRRPNAVRGMIGPNSAWTGNTIRPCDYPSKFELVDRSDQQNRYANLYQNFPNPHLE